MFLNFNGTAGIWRAEAIADAGGWAHDTLTEDLDLSYRAQLRGWRALYLPDVVCPAELPAQIAAFKAQQRRWATGSIQTARKLIPAILRCPRSPWAKCQAVLHLTHYLVHPLMLVVVLLSLPLILLEGVFPAPAPLMVTATLFALSTFGPSNLYVYGERQLGPGWPRRLRHLPFLMLLGTGIALSNTRAVLKGLTGRPLEFVRTPKFGLETARETWRDKAYRLRGAWEGLEELGPAIYAFAGTCAFLHTTRYFIFPFMAIYTLGFAQVGSLTLLQPSKRPAPWRPRRTIGMNDSSLARTPWRQIATRPVYSNKWMAVREDQVRLPDGRETIYGVVDCGQCVGVLPFVDPSHVLLVGQYRYVAKRFTWEMPTGGARPGESLESAAQRELTEEAGYRARRLTWVSTYHTSKSVMDETAHLYLAEDLTAAGREADDTEFIERRAFPFREALDMVLRAEITDGMTVIAVLHAARRLAV